MKSAWNTYACITEDFVAGTPEIFTYHFFKVVCFPGFSEVKISFKSMFQPVSLVFFRLILK